VKILLVAPQPFYTERGTPIAVKLLVESLCSFGHRVDLLVYHEGSDISIPGMRLIRTRKPPGVDRVPIGISWQKIVCDVWLTVKFMQLIRTTRYDVVHAVEEAVFPAAALMAWSKVRLVYDMDSSLSEQVVDKWAFLRPLRFALEFFERLVVTRANLTLAVCEDLAVKARRWTHRDKVITLPDVPMAETQREVHVESLRQITGEASTVALYVGNLEKYQGIDLLLESLARLPAESRLHTVIIGGIAAHIDKYRAMAASLGIADRVHLLGGRPVDHLGAYLAQADVLLSPRTLGGNTPMKIYSYMQSGKAILATDIRSHTQALDSRCAMLVDSKPDAMARGLAQLEQDSELRRSIGDAARAKVESEYSLPVYSAKLRAAYEGLQNS
jgi:glycosyltransferase involved in cell wall biosynthesis